MIGMCPAPTIEGDRVYTMTNRCEVVCLDLDGQADGNDGPFVDEGRHMTPEGQPALEVTAIDADIVWLTDLRTAIDMYPHDSSHTAILLDGDTLYLNTCNGVDNTHAVVRKPDAPSLIAIDKNTGAIIAKDPEGMGHRIFHSTWAPPAMGTVNGVKQIVFGGPDGECYGFEALPHSRPADSVQPLQRLWRFDCDPTSPKEDRASYLRNRKVSPSVIESMPVFIGDRVYVTVGGDIWWGKELSWLKCIDATKSGDITETGQVWSYEMPTHCVSTPSIANGLVFIGDCKGVVHCVDANTGQPYWTHDIGGEIWGSALTADGKVYIGSRNKEFWTFAASKELKVLGSVKLDAPISSTPTAANGVLYVASLDTLYAVK
ncbi:MAG: pyrrolo-quinoline quinone [Verrucomicrobia bacterium]|nr:pyrrolo-quinoline quinone [Verrucomicrobiota bacterium]